MRSSWRSTRVAPPFVSQRYAHEGSPSPSTRRLTMATSRSSGASRVVKVVLVGLCALPLAAGYADARVVNPPRPPATPSPAGPFTGVVTPPPGRFPPPGAPPPVDQPAPPGKLPPAGAPSYGRLSSAGGPAPTKPAAQGKSAAG